MAHSGTRGCSRRCWATATTSRRAEEVLDEWHWVIDRAEEHLGPMRAARYLKKFHPWYVERLGAPKAVQDELQRAETLDEQRAVLLLSCAPSAPVQA